MKKIIAACTIIFFLACTQNNNTPALANKNSNEVPIVLEPTKMESLIGSFVGPFGDNKITVLITKTLGDTIEGRSIVGGNDRPFKGTYTVKDDVYNIAAKEPGTDKYDGTFTMQLNNKKPNAITGTWQPYKENAHGGPKTFSLQRMAFTYNPTVGIFPQASTRLLKDADVENLLKQELQNIRNTIFARHGYCFKKAEVRQQFETEPWYIPSTTDVTQYLTDVEKKNIALIKKYEKYADEYGDDFGR